MLQLLFLFKAEVSITFHLFLSTKPRLCYFYDYTFCGGLSSYANNRSSFLWILDGVFVLVGGLRVVTVVLGVVVVVVVVVVDVVVVDV